MNCVVCSAEVFALRSGVSTAAVDAAFVPEIGTIADFLLQYQVLSDEDIIAKSSARLCHDCCALVSSGRKLCRRFFIVVNALIGRRTSSLTTNRRHEELFSEQVADEISLEAPQDYEEIDGWEIKPNIADYVLHSESEEQEATEVEEARRAAEEQQSLPSVMGNRMKEQVDGSSEDVFDLVGQRFPSALESLDREGSAGAGPGSMKPQFACPECGLGFATSHAQQVHLFREHLKKFRYQCSECDRGYYYRQALETHCAKAHGTTAAPSPKVRREPDVDLKECTSSGKNVADEMDDSSAPTINGEKYPCSCSECGQEFPTIKSKKAHIYKEHLKRFAYQCQDCHKGYYYRQAFETHRARVHGSSAGIPMEPGTGAKSAESLEERRTCKVCGKTFSQARFVVMHMHKEHGTPYKFQCSECEKGFHTKSGLQNHMMNHQVRDEDKRLCPHCGLYLAANAYFNHLLSHGPPRRKDPAECEFCGAVFQYKSSLIRHLARTHNVGDPHRAEFKLSCPSCGHRFLTKERLCAHAMRKHGIRMPGLREYNCPHCDKVFHVELRFREHLSSHSGGMYECQVCGFRTSYQSSYYLHTRTVHGISHKKTPAKDGNEGEVGQEVQRDDPGVALKM